MSGAELANLPLGGSSRAVERVESSNIEGISRRGLFGGRVKSSCGPLSGLNSVRSSFFHGRRSTRRRGVFCALCAAGSRVVFIPRPSVNGTRRKRFTRGPSNFVAAEERAEKEKKTSAPRGGVESIKACYICVHTAGRRGRQAREDDVSIDQTCQVSRVSFS